MLSNTQLYFGMVFLSRNFKEPFGAYEIQKGNKQELNVFRTTVTGLP